MMMMMMMVMVVVVVVVMDVAKGADDHACRCLSPPPCRRI
jgi:hypothetical protein